LYSPDIYNWLRVIIILYATVITYDLVSALFGKKNGFNTSRIFGYLNKLRKRFKIRYLLMIPIIFIYIFIIGTFYHIGIYVMLLALFIMLLSS
jgi:hypothetical protein